MNYDSRATEMEFSPTGLRRARILAVSALALLLLAVPHRAAAGTPIPIQTTTLNLFDTSAKTVAPYVVPWHCTTSALPNGMGVSFAAVAAGDFGSVTMYNIAQENFSTAGATALDVLNPNAFDVTLTIKLFDTSNRAFEQEFTVPANSSRSLALLHRPLGLANNFGMKAVPDPYAGYTVLTAFNWSGMDFAHVQYAQLFTRGPSPAETIVVDNLRLLAAYDLNQLMLGCVDAYGQNNLAPFTGKLAGPGDFATRRASEEAGFGNLLAGHVDSYGGSLDYPQQPATGLFHTAKVNGKWWLIDPLGHLFFMQGMDTADPGGYQTTTGGRQSLFASLPQAGDPLTANYGTANGSQTYNFYTANLQRKYGTNWRPSWNDTFMKRMASWGFNTIGSWSDNWPMNNGSMPYVMNLSLGSGYATVSTGSDLWGPAPDPWDPAFMAAVASTQTWYVNQTKNDPNCIGFTIGNEISFAGNQTGGYKFYQYALAYGTLKLDASASPAKVQFVKQLRQRYGRITLLNANWATHYRSWNELNAPQTFGDNITYPMQRDFSNWMLTYATKFYSGCKSWLKSLAPNSLYLGSAISRWSPEVVKASALNCDVVSFTLYDLGLPADLGAAIQQVDAPCMITEFSFGQSDSGLFGPGLIPLTDGPSRAAAMATFVNLMLDHPQFVGCNWYQYVDEPQAGAVYGGGNDNLGFLDVTDTPYPELVSTAKQVHLGMYSRRYN